MAIVYLATCTVNGKRYVGVTKRLLRQRRANHESNAAGGSPYRFHSAIRKYGKENFRWEVLMRFETEEAAWAAETNLILEMRPEYNAIIGGGILRHSLATREVLRQHGLAQRDEWMERRHLGPDASARPVRCLDDDLIYPSASAAARAYNTAKSAIIELCNGAHKHRHSVRGRRFVYVDQTQKETAALRARARSGRRAKLTRADVSIIRSLFPTMRDTEIAGRFNVSDATINDIYSGRTWKEV